MIKIKCSKNIFPKTTVLEITNTCNLRCIHCYLDKSEQNLLELPVCINIIDQLSKLGCFKIILTGGEVFLHKEILFELVKKAKMMDFEVTIITNCTLCSFDDITYLKQIGLDNLNVSLYGKDMDSYLQITGSRHNVSQLKAKILYAKKIGIKVTVLSAGINDLYFDLVDLQRWCDENKIQFNIAFVIYGNENGHQFTNSLSEEQIIKLLLKDKRDYSIYFNNSCNPRSPKDFCSAGVHTICIAANGNVYPCANWRIKVGSIFTNSIAEIWNKSEELVKIRNSSYEEFECAECENFNICPVCPGINYSATGVAQKPSPELCKYARAIHKCSILKQNEDYGDCRV